MKTDLGIKPTRDVCERISTSVADDPAKMVEYYVEIQKRFGPRLFSGPTDDQEGTAGIAEQGLADIIAPNPATAYSAIASMGLAVSGILRRDWRPPWGMTASLTPACSRWPAAAADAERYGTSGT